jgi:hypothetical protein
LGICGAIGGGINKSHMDRTGQWNGQNQPAGRIQIDIIFWRRSSASAPPRHHRR